MKGNALKLTFVLLSGTICGSGAPAQEESKPSIYYKTQAAADAALAQFDDDNPDCQLWTNWQKMCAKTGVGSDPGCVRDARNAVPPSTPFCVVKKSGFARPGSGEGDLKGLSALRFCKKFRAISSSDVKNKETLRSCTEFSEKRPFSFRTKHPLNKKIIFQEKPQQCAQATTTKSGGNEWPLQLGNDEIDTRAGINLKMIPVFGAYCNRFVE